MVVFREPRGVGLFEGEDAQLRCDACGRIGHATRARAVVATAAPPDAVPQIAAAIAARELIVPIAATFPIEQISEAAAQQEDRHVHGKIVVTL